MSTQRAENFALEMIGENAGVSLCAILLELPEPLLEADGVDASGRSVILIGRHWLGYEAAGHATVKMVLRDLRDGLCPETVHLVIMAPKASAAIRAAILGPDNGQVLVHGPRGTGKTHALAAAAMINAEWHLRAQCPIQPFRVLWLHDSLLSAATKTGSSLQLPMWGGLWKLKDDSRKAVCRIAGQELIEGNFVGCLDEESQQRLRLECHMVLAEELIASMTDGTGVSAEKWDLARSSMDRGEEWRTRRRVAMAATNPGGPDTWPYQRWLAGPRQPTTVAVQVPWTDRETPEQHEAKRQTFAYSPIMQKRLADGEWIMAEQGATVAEGFDAAVHVSRTPLRPNPNYLLAIGWDGGHSPSAVVGQHILSQVSIYAALNQLNVGVLELIEAQVWPWLKEYAPWAVQNGGADLVHIIDPNMATPGQATITESAERIILAKLGGRIVHGAVRWPPRREAILRLLAPRHEQGRVPVRIDPEAHLLIDAFQGRWFYKVDTDGQINRQRPEKPNSPWADIGDAAAYLAGWLLGGELMDVPLAGPIKVETEFSLDRASRNTEYAFTL